MMEEHFMRSWNQGHDRFSADLHRGLTRMLGALRRFGEWIALPSAPGTSPASVENGTTMMVNQSKRRVRGTIILALQSPAECVQSLRPLTNLRSRTRAGE